MAAESQGPINGWIAPTRWRVPDSTPVKARLLLLKDLAFVGSLDPEVQAFARRSVRKNGTEAEKAADVLRAAQSLGYHPDPPGEWYQQVRQTLKAGGDCEDLCSALEAIALVVGIKADPAWIDQPGSPLNHVSTKMLVDGKWLWADPTVVGARLGEHPYAAFNRLNQWHKIAAASELGLYQNAA